MGLRDIIPRGLYAIPSTVPESSAPPSAPNDAKAVAYSVAEPTVSQKLFGRNGKGVAYAAAEPVVSEKPPIKMYSRDFYVACATGGAMSCGLTHCFVTPIDVVKCNMQIDPIRYKSIGSGFGIAWSEGGLAGLFRGWSPTLIGYGFQGMCKFGFYEYFKKLYSDMAGAETAAKYQTPIFLVASASAELIADVALCPWEAVKVKVQTVPGYAKGLTDGMPKVISQEGIGGLFKPLVPLWGRQIPYTMMKFAAFENIVNSLYANVVPKPKSECSKTEQLGVSFAAGYLAGILCAVVSQPADNMVSKLSSNPKATVGSVFADMGIVKLTTVGLPLRIIMVGTLTGLQWGIYDAYKAYCKIPTSGGGTPKVAPK